MAQELAILVVHSGSSHGPRMHQSCRRLSGIHQIDGSKGMGLMKQMARHGVRIVIIDSIHIIHSFSPSVLQYRYRTREQHMFSDYVADEHVLLASQNILETSAQSSNTRHVSSSKAYAKSINAVI